MAERSLLQKDSVSNDVNTVFYRKITIVKNMAAEMVNFLLVIAVSYTFEENILQNHADVMPLLLLVWVPLFFYFLREVCQKLSLFLLFHLLPLGAVLFIYHAGSAEKVFVIGTSAVFLVMSFAKRLSGKNGWGMEALMPLGAIGILVILYLLDAIQGNGQCGAFLLIITILFAFGYFIFYFLKQFLHYMDMNNRTTDNIPVRNVFYSAMGLAGGFTAITVSMVGLITNRELWDRIGHELRGALLRALSFLLSLFPESQEPTEVERTEEVMEELVWEAADQITEESEILKVLDKFIEIIALVIICVALIAAITVVIRLIRAAFVRRQKKQLIEDETFIDHVEDLKPVNDGKRKKGSSLWGRFWESLSPEEKIRRIYKKTMLKKAPSWEGEKKAEILKKKTARESCVQFFPQAQEEAQALADLYEKARYGNGSCRQEDVRRARLLADRLSQER